MFIAIGMLIVIIAVMGGFAMEGGSFILLLQVAEFIIIGGAALGGLFISASPVLLKNMIIKIKNALFSPRIDKVFYINLFKLLYDLFQIVRVKGILGLDEHIENPEKSSVFNRYPMIKKKMQVISFIVDTLRLMSIGNVPSHNIEAIMDNDAEILMEEDRKSGLLIAKVGDSLPGLGIVAAVLGIILTMKVISGNPEEVGHKVAAALVGTFLGVLLSYGFVQPLATHLEILAEEEGKVYEVIKSSITAFSQGLHPIYAIEFGRRSIPASLRPKFIEMEKALKQNETSTVSLSEEESQNNTLGKLPA